MPGGFATDNSPALLEFLEHVAIANAGAMEFDVPLLQGVLQAQVAHHGANDRPMQPAFLLPRRRQDIQDLVAVDELTVFVDEHDAIPVAIQRDTDVSGHGGHCELQQVGPSRTAAIIDVASVRRATDRNDLGIEVRQRARPDLVARTVGAVEDHLQAAQIQTFRER